jgi:acetylornithine deacetylase/succinyl-diaminopimelate desuccinylase-like protein
VTDLDPAWLDELSAWLRIPSVSADPAHAGDVRAAGEWICDLVRGAGGESGLVETRAHPLAVGQIAASSGADGAPTVLLYGHFDVQPPGDPRLWESPPFEPEIRDGWLFGRGTVDDKGNLYMLLKASALLAAEGVLPVNLRIVCDGEEEIGGTSIVDFLAADEGRADACLVFDTGMPEIDQPAFDIATRGLAYFHVTARTGARDLHSGIYGGAALNAIHALAAALDRVVAVPDELRAGAAPPSAEERSSWERLAPGAEVLEREGARPMDATAAEEYYLRTGAGPAVDVHGIHGGSPDLQKTVLPVEAHANVSIRIAPGQDAGAVANDFERLLRAGAPPGTELEVALWSVGEPGLIPPNAPAVRLAQAAFERVVGRRPLLLRSGGTIPIIPALADKGIPTVLSGFAVPGNNIHAPNERLLARYLTLGVEAARETLVAFRDLPRS